MPVLRLLAEQGALFLKALDSAVEALEQDDWHPDTEREDEFAEVENAPAGAFSANLPEQPELLAQRRADGLVMMAESQLTHLNSTSKTADRYQVVVHADVSGELPRYGLEDGPAVPAESVKRLCCDASVSQVISDNGEPVSIGRKSRTIPPPMRRAVSQAATAPASSMAITYVIGLMAARPVSVILSCYVNFIIAWSMRAVFRYLALLIKVPVPIKAACSSFTVQMGNWYHRHLSAHQISLLHTMVRKNTNTKRPGNGTEKPWTME